MVVEGLAVPVVQAPMAGGPSTPALAAAVCEAGGLGFVAAGYKGVDALRDDLAATRALTGRPFGVNVFAPAGPPAGPADLARYLARLEAEARALGVALGPPRHDDDAYAGKVAALVADRPAVVSFTFGLPGAGDVAALHAAGSEVWMTVTSVAEARAAAERGADALVVQGLEAGGHRGSFADDDAEGVGLLALLQLVGAAVDVPLVATGGIATGRAVAAVLVAGAAAAQLGTAFLRCREAGTSPAQRGAVGTEAPTGLTRAFTGRRARGVVNRFQAEHSRAAPSAYPEVHHVTAPLRARARAAGDADAINLWAGQAHALTREMPAGELVRQLADEARAALAGTRL
jgi:nitronate monooxygenase